MYGKSVVISEYNTIFATYTVFNYLPMKKEFIIRVRFFQPIDGKTDFYFGSLAAIYVLFSDEQIGCNLRTLYCSKITESDPKVTRTCIISKFTVYRKSNKKFTLC